MTTSVEAAEKEFHLRYFDWCIEQVHIAADEHFQHVKAIQGYYAGVLQEFLEEFGEDEGLDLCLALLKKAHPGVLQIRAESLRKSEILLVDKFKAFARSGGSVMRIPKKIRNCWPIDTEQQDTLIVDDIRTALGCHLSPHLGQPFRGEARGLLEFRHNVNDWIVFTNITAEEDDAYWSIRYTHTISARSDLDAELIGSSISYLGWLGLPTTQWDNVLRQDLNSIASMLLQFTQIFLSAAPRLLADIINPMKVC